MAFYEVKSMKKNFDKLEVLKGVDISLEKGEVLVIIGASGSGKTTLLRCINFLEKPDEGTIKVNGETIFDWSDKQTVSDEQIRQKRLHFGLVFQSFNLFPQYTVKKNITLACELLEQEKLKKKQNKKRFALLSKGEKHIISQEVEERAERLLEQVGLSEKSDAYPCQLSGGQQQRVAIARALALSPDILCFDEPTSALDPELTGEVLRVIKNLKNEDRTMIIVTHEMEFARNVADKVIFMANGVVEEMGSPSDVFDNPQSELLKSFLSKSLESI